MSKMPAHGEKTADELKNELRRSESDVDTNKLILGKIKTIVAKSLNVPENDLYVGEDYFAGEMSYSAHVGVKSGPIVVMGVSREKDGRSVFTVHTSYTFVPEFVHAHDLFATRARQSSRAQLGLFEAKIATAITNSFSKDGELYDDLGFLFKQGLLCHSIAVKV